MKTFRKVLSLNVVLIKFDALALGFNHIVGAWFLLVTQRPDTAIY